MGSTDIGNCLPNPRGNGGYPILLHHHWLLLQGNLEMERLPVALGPHLSSSSLRNAPPGWHVQSTVLGSLAGTLSQGLPISPGFFPTSRCPMAKEVGPNGGFSQPLLRHLLGTWHTALSFHSVSNHSAVRKPPLSPLTEDRPRLGKMKHLPTPVNSKVAQRDWDPQFSDSEAATLSTTAPPRPWGLKTDGSLERSLLCSLFRETRAPPHVFPSPIHAESATARKFAQVHCGRSGCMSGVRSTRLPGEGETEAAQPPAQRGSHSTSPGSPGALGEPPSGGQETVTFKSWISFSKNFSPIHLARQRGLLGPGGPGLAAPRGRRSGRALRTPPPAGVLSAGPLGR